MSLNEESLIDAVATNKKKLTTIYKNNFDILKHFTILTDISKLKEDFFIKYVKRDEMNKVYYGGKVDSIDEKSNGDYSIVFKSNNGLKWSLLLSKVFIFYREKTMTEIRKIEYEKWKKNMEENNPEEFEKWKNEKKLKESIRKKDPELYKKLYVHIKTSKK